MNAEMIKTLDVMPLDQPTVRFATAKHFANAGDCITGLLVGYHPMWGATTYDGDDCGSLMLLTDRENVIKIALDKGQLATAVGNALTLADAQIGPPTPKLVRVTYEGADEAKGWKRYSVKVGYCRNIDAVNRLLGGRP